MREHRVNAPPAPRGDMVAPLQTSQPRTRLGNGVAPLLTHRTSEPATWFQADQIKSAVLISRDISYLAPNKLLNIVGRPATACSVRGKPRSLVRRDSGHQLLPTLIRLELSSFQIFHSTSVHNKGGSLIQETGEHPLEMNTFDLLDTTQICVEFEFSYFDFALLAI